MAVVRMTVSYTHLDVYKRQELDPVLPKEWTGYTFRIQIGSSRLSVTVSREEARVTLTDGGEICFRLYGQDKTLRKAGDYVTEKI